MAGGLSDGDEDITDINVTPLVDVMLVLLIIFMVTASYIANRSINVNLPKASTGEDGGVRNIAFVLDKESNLYLDGTATSFPAMEEVLKEKLEGGEKLQALIAADEGTPHGTVIKLIDVIRKNGITDFAINVEAQ